MTDHLQELDVDRCLALLGEHHFGRVAVNDEDGPVVFPVNYVLDRGTVVFRTSLGTKLDAAVGRSPATFEIDGVDERRRLGWSVIVRGRLEEVSDSGELERLRELDLEPFAGGERDHYVQVLSATITGRRIPLPEQIPTSWFDAPDVGHIWFGQDGSDLLG